MGLADLTLQLIIFRVLASLLILTLQGGVIAGLAVMLGDQGPRHDGRLTLMPAAHVDLVGAVCLILFGFGWSRSVAVDEDLLRAGQGGVVIVILGGCVGLIGAAFLCHALIQPALTMLSLTAGLAMAAFLRTAVSLLVSCALLGLVPLPPLAGGMVLKAFGIGVPPKVQWIATALVVCAIASGMVGQIVTPAATVIMDAILAT